VAVLGSPETAASRLNLAQGVNSVAKVIAPIFGGALILSGIDGLPKEQQAEAVQMPYVGLAIALFVLAGVFAFITLPNLRDLDSVKESNKIAVKGKNSIFDFPYLLLGAGAIFMYVGAEVTVASFMVSFLGEESIAGLDKESASKYLSFYWGGLMVGRFVGAAVLQKIKSQTLLAIMAVAAILFLITGITMTGWTAGWAIILIGFCNSIMWSNIFTLAIDGLGKFTSKGSGLLVMAIVGGAFVPLLHGYLADRIGLQSSYVVAIFCYVYILFYAVSGYKIGKAKV
jgi:FHS family L-fucose permease-like MFS transporter